MSESVEDNESAYIPSPYVSGVVYELRAIADQLELGTMFVAEFSLASDVKGEKLQIQIIPTC